MASALWAERELREEVGPGGCHLIASRREMREILELGRGRVSESTAAREMARMLRQLVPQMSVDAEEIEMGKSYATSHPKDCGTCDGSGLLAGPAACVAALA